MKKFALGIIFIFLASGIYAQWNWTVGNGGNSGRYSLAGTVLGPLTADSVLWDDGALSSYWPHQVFTIGDTMVTDRTFNIGNTLHGTYIVAYNINDGTELWTADLPVDFPDEDWRNRVCGISGELVYATRSGNTNASYLYALDIDDGTIVWKSEDLVDMSSTEGVVYAENGDLLVGNFNNILRIDATDGSTVWMADRSSPTSGGSQVMRYGDHVYGWSAGPYGPVISVFDTGNGELLYESRPIGGGIIQQIPPLAGPDGTVYAPRAANNPLTDTLVAFLDTGTDLKEQWKMPMAYVPFGTHGVGPDGSFYMYSRDSTIFRILEGKGVVAASQKINLPGPSRTIGLGGIKSGIARAESGWVKCRYYRQKEVIPVDTSIFIFDPEAVVNSPFMAIDAEGNVFVANETKVFAFDYALNLLWEDAVTDVGYIALAKNGNLIVPAENDVIKVYGGRGALYAVTFFVHDQFNDPLYHAEVIVGQDTVYTGMDGEAVFVLPTGEISYTVNFEEQTVSSTYTVTSDPGQVIDVVFFIAGINETFSGKIKIHPNPANEEIIVSFPDDLPGSYHCEISLQTLHGQTVKTCFITGNHNRINLGGMLPGIYLARIENGKQVVYRKIVVN